MSSRFKTANIIAILIAVILIAIGFALNYIHMQSESEKNRAKTVNDTITKTMSTPEATLARVALIHAGLSDLDLETHAKSETDRISQSIDWSNSPAPVPELVKTDDYGEPKYFISM